MSLTWIVTESDDLVQYLMPIIPALKRKAGSCEFEVSLGHRIEALLKERKGGKGEGTRWGERSMTS
jgi:hypothetical protein